MKNDKSEKDKNKPSAFADLIEQVEKEKKRAKVIYSIASVVAALLIIIFLLFGPLSVPLFSQLGDRILGREDTQFKEKVLDAKKESESLDKLEEEQPEKEEEGEIENQEKSLKETVISKEQVTICTQKDINFYTENYCYWLEYGNSNDLLYWKNSLNTCGISNLGNLCTLETSPEVSSQIEPKTREFSCSQETMNSYVYTYCISYGDISYYESALLTGPQMYSECVAADPFCSSQYSEIVYKCEQSCRDYSVGQLDYYQDMLLESQNRVLQYKNLLISCGWYTSEVEELNSQCSN